VAVDVTFTKCRMYPSGTGETKKQFAAIFIRPIKNSIETAFVDDWQRPIDQFSFRVRNADGEELFVHESDPSFNLFSNDAPGWYF
jgi:hypothetical protein